jgi:hypothetical protein
MKIGRQPDERPAAVCVSSSSTPILTDERPPLGADGPLRSIEIPFDLSIKFANDPYECARTTPSAARDIFSPPGEKRSSSFGSN